MVVWIIVSLASQLGVIFLGGSPLVMWVLLVVNSLACYGLLKLTSLLIWTIFSEAGLVFLLLGHWGGNQIFIILGMVFLLGLTPFVSLIPLPLFFEGTNKFAAIYVITCSKLGYLFLLISITDNTMLQYLALAFTLNAFIMLFTNNPIILLNLSSITSYYLILSMATYSQSLATLFLFFYTFSTFFFYWEVTPTNLITSLLSILMTWTPLSISMVLKMTMFANCGIFLSFIWIMLLLLGFVGLLNLILQSKEGSGVNLHSVGIFAMYFLILFLFLI